MTITIRPQDLNVLVEENAGSVEIQPQSASVDAEPRAFDLSIGSQIVREFIGGEPYTGSYTVTPTTEEQTLPTMGKLLTQNVTVGAIPSNYGLITWSGSTLTVS